MELGFYYELSMLICLFIYNLDVATCANMDVVKVKRDYIIVILSVQIPQHFCGNKLKGDDTCKTDCNVVGALNRHRHMK
jgi:hypothetical protein